MMGSWNNLNTLNWGDPRFRIGFLLFTAWTVFWKGLALWKAARNDERYWFVALLLLNTAGLLELAYLFIFTKEKIIFVREAKLRTQPKSKKK